MSTLKTISTRRRQKQRGSTMVELALTFLGFMFLLFGIMDFSWALLAQTFCYAEAQDAVRWASVRGSQNPGGAATPDDITAYVRSQSAPLVASQLTVTSCWIAAGSACNPDPTGRNSPGSNVQITVSYPITPLSYVGIKEGFTASATSNTVINQ